jgi:biotin operon repressor
MIAMADKRRSPN